MPNHAKTMDAKDESFSYSTKLGFEMTVAAVDK